jgi:anoctamin-1
MRVDAKKFLLFFKRSVPKRVSDIGIWNNIVQFLGWLKRHLLLNKINTLLSIIFRIFPGKFSVVISAFIIAFSSNFIPKMFYQFHGELSEGSYLEFMFTKVNVTDHQVNFIGYFLSPLSKHF